MKNLILVWIIVATVVAPAIGAGDRNARRGLKRTVALLLAFNVVYLAIVLLVFIPFYRPELW